jgi:hypothetical protein
MKTVDPRIVGRWAWDNYMLQYQAPKELSGESGFEAFGLVAWIEEVVLGSVIAVGWI